jgi:hypothetical protein
MPMTGEQKSARTDLAARQIMNTELAARQKKTARLRELRLEKEEAERLERADKPAAPKRGGKKAS